MSKNIDLYALASRLYPINRSLTGEGVRETLRILQEFIPLEIQFVNSGESYFDWIVPREWTCEEAYIIDPNGNKILDFNHNNLHLLGYSIPYEGELSLQELMPHLYSLPDQPELIPYVTSYYKDRWGFCLPHNQLLSLSDGKYYVKIDSRLFDGVLNYGELLIKGMSNKEILLSSYVCHPSMANNELSGPVVLTGLTDYLLKNNQLYYSYRIILIPETIGSIIYIAKNLETLKKNVIGGYVLTCCGDPGPFSYLQTPSNNSLVDRITLHLLRNSSREFKKYDFLERGSDERQYNSPGIDLNIGSLMRSKYGTFPEYHTSADNMQFITAEALNETLEEYIKLIQIWERNKVYIRKTFCEPNLGKRELYPTISLKGQYPTIRKRMNLLAFMNGESCLLEIAERINLPIWELYDEIDILINAGLVSEI